MEDVVLYLDGGGKVCVVFKLIYSVEFIGCFYMGI